VPVKQRFTPKKKLRIWIAGDSLVITPGWSIVRASGASPVLESVGGVDGRVATGLTRPDVFNWFEEIRTQVKKLKPNVVVLNFGGNDDKGYMTGLPEGASIGDFGSPSRSAESMAARLARGSAPGCPRHTGQTFELGGAPKAAAQPQNILVRVPSWMWHSRPITAS